MVFEWSGDGRRFRDVRRTVDSEIGCHWTKDTNTYTGYKWSHDIITSSIPLLSRLFSVCFWPVRREVWKDFLDIFFFCLFGSSLEIFELGERGAEGDRLWNLRLVFFCVFCVFCVLCVCVFWPRERIEKDFLYNKTWSAVALSNCAASNFDDARRRAA